MKLTNDNSGRKLQENTLSQGKAQLRQTRQKKPVSVSVARRTSFDAFKDRRKVDKNTADLTNSTLHTASKKGGSKLTPPSDDVSLVSPLTASFTAPGVPQYAKFYTRTLQSTSKSPTASRTDAYSPTFKDPDGTSEAIRNRSIFDFHESLKSSTGTSYVSSKSSYSTSGESSKSSYVTASLSSQSSASSLSEYNPLPLLPTFVDDRPAKNFNWPLTPPANSKVAERSAPAPTFGNSEKRPVAYVNRELASPKILELVESHKSLPMFRDFENDLKSLIHENEKAGLPMSVGPVPKRILFWATTKKKAATTLAFIRRHANTYYYGNSGLEAANMVETSSLDAAPSIYSSSKDSASKYSSSKYSSRDGSPAPRYNLFPRALAVNTNRFGLNTVNLTQPSFSAMVNGSGIRFQEDYWGF